jgi:predicted patatin/cPLA2 family phospholipase
MTERMAKDTALVLEGGGFRALYGTGVLDVMLERGLMYPHLFGVSMGAVNGASFLSRQPGRCYRFTVEYMKDRRYMGIRNLIREGNFFGHSFAYHEIPRQFVKFDMKTYYTCPEKLTIVATDTQTAKAHYFSKNDYEVCELVGASTALPFFSTMVEIQGHRYLDGGIADSIPIHYAFEQGYTKAVVVLSRPRGSRLKAYDPARQAFIRMRYKSFPELAEALIDRHSSYNATMEELEKLEDSGRIFVMQPREPIDMKVIDRSEKGVSLAYQTGRTQMEERWDDLLAYLNLNSDGNRV